MVEAMRQQRQEDYSVLGLLLNIEKMEEYLRVKGLMDHLATFRYGSSKFFSNRIDCICVDGVHASAHVSILILSQFNFDMPEHRRLSAKLKQPTKPWAKVPPPAFKGNVTEVLRSIIEFAKTKDYTASMAVLFDLLLRNTEILPLCPADLQRPESTGGDHNEQIQVGESLLYFALHES